jgi:hypothetical protein
MIIRFILAVSILISTLHAENNESIFIDPEDGYLDLSRFLASKHGFLPVPILITGPTFEFGGGLNIMFLHDKLAGHKRSDGKYIPPAISGVAAAATQNGTKFAAAYHLGFWLEGDLRTTTFVGRPNANMDFGTPLGSVSLNTLGYAFYQEAKYRFLDTNLFLGANYTYMNIKTSPNNLPDPLNDFANQLIDDKTYSGLAAAAEYDSRDSIFTPNRGIYGKAVLAFFNEALGSDRNFNNLRTKLFYYNQLRDDLVLGARIEYQSILGNNRAPAFMTPSIQLRGLPGYEYIGQNTLVGELEMRYEVAHRNWLVAFTGTGKAYGDYSSDGDISFSDAPTPVTYGLGYRYTIAKAFKMLVGFDVARHGDNTSFYITVGSAWNAFY